MSGLTERQADILYFIQDSITRNGYPPSNNEIRAYFGFASVNAVRDHIAALERKGYLQRTQGQRRSIRVLKDASTTLTDQFQLPLVGQIAAGTPITASENVDIWLKVDPTIFSPRADFLHKVAGHSMKEANIFDGDIVGIHGQEDADNNQIVAAVLPSKAGGEEVTLKRYSRRGNTVILKSENSANMYRPIEIDLSNFDPDSQDRPPFRIAGVFAGLIRVPR